jgi:hypothetical protein
LGHGQKVPSVSHDVQAAMGTDQGTSYSAPRVCAEVIDRLIQFGAGPVPAIQPLGLIKALLARRFGKWNPRRGFGDLS